MADSLPGHFLPLTAESGQEPTLLVDALGSGNPTLLAPTGVHRQDSLLLSLLALARSVPGTLFLSRAA